MQPAAAAAAQHAAPCRPTGLAVFALDAAQPFDFEARARARLQQEQQLTIGIVGFGTFGQFLAKRMGQAGHR
jgi:arogenate dehydrogenase (NADP+)